MLRRAVSRDEVSEGRLVILLVLFLVRRLVLFLVFLALLLGARDDDDGVGVPPGGDSSGSARGWREIADEARAARDRGEERDGVRGGFEGRRGIGSGGGWGVVSRGRVAGCAVASVAAPIDERDARASLSGVEDAATRREDVALLRTLGEDALAELGVRARVRSEKICEACVGGGGGVRASGAARRGDDGRAVVSDGARRSCVQRPRWFDATARTERVAVVFGVVQLEHPEVVHHRRRKARRLGGARRRHHRHRARRRVLRDDTAGVVVAVVTGHADRKRSLRGPRGNYEGMRNVRPHTEIRDCRIDGLRRRSSAPE